MIRSIHESHVIGWTLSTLMCLGLINGLRANALDTISPIIVQTSQDIAISCDGAIEDTLQNWFDRFAGLVVQDENSDIIYQSEITPSEALARLDLDIDISCGMTGSVSVGFFALDTCMNSSDTSYSIFEIIDTTGPVFAILPSDITIQCTANRSDSLNIWISNFGGAVINDNCDLLATLDSYRYSINEGTPIIGNFDQSLEITPDQCDYRIAVTFIAIDECGNTYPNHKNKG